MKLQSTLHRTQGQAAVIIALAIVVLVGAAGLGLDGANAFNQRRNASNAADAAAMSGADVLIREQREDPLDSNGAVAVRNAVSTYLSNHGIDPTSPNNPWTAYYVDSSGSRIGAVSTSGSVNTSAKGVSVDLRYTFGTYFMPVLGRSTLTVGGSATAIFGKKKLDGADILPITMSKQAAEDMKDDEGDTYVFGPDSGAHKINPGNFGAISLDPDEDDPNRSGSNHDCLNPSSPPPDDNPRYWWCNGTDHDIEVGDWLYGDPGELSGNVRTEVQWRIANQPYGLIPVYDTSNDLSGNNTRYRIVGFLVVELTGEHLTGGTKTISAKYKNYVVSTGAIDFNSPTTGLYTINLVKTPGTLQ
jgi:Flp pilus assembly protein TadG